MSALVGYGTPLYRDGATQVVYDARQKVVAMAQGWRETPAPPVVSAPEPAIAAPVAVPKKARKKGTR